MVKNLIEDSVRETISKYVHDHFQAMFGDYKNLIISDAIITHAVEDVIDTSALIDEGYFSDGDIVLACQRAIAYFIVKNMK